MSTKLVILTLNGKQIEAPEGANLLQVAKNNGVGIAHYCYHEALPIAGVCRLCLVEVDGSPKPVPSCNLTVKEGMKVVSNSEKIQNIVKWGLQFHLINHPLDCPICDQAGECVLQESYMQYGIYDSNMTEPKVHKKKVVDLGPRIVLDKERCILCARCTRFTEHVTQTHDLGIFNRGDRSEIGTYQDKPFDNTYSINTVDICPVGALTSKDFRFKQRVWFTQKHPSVCIKCSTGCSIDVWGNNKGYYRVTPRKNMDVNQWWMCDAGRTSYFWLNPENRYLSTESSIDEVIGEIEQDLGGTGWLIAPQHTIEEYEAIYGFLKAKKVPVEHVFIWHDHPGEVEKFDGLLIRGDKHPNTKGLQGVAKSSGYSDSLLRFQKEFLKAKFERVIVLGPENIESCFSLNHVLKEHDSKKVWISSARLPSLDLESCVTHIIPTKVFSEKNGTYINAQEKPQTIKAFMTAPPKVIDLKSFFTSRVQEK